MTDPVRDSYSKKGTIKTAMNVVKHRGYLGLWSGFRLHLRESLLASGSLVIALTHPIIKCETQSVVPSTSRLTRVSSSYWSSFKAVTRQLRHCQWQFPVACVVQRGGSSYVWRTSLLYELCSKADFEYRHTLLIRLRPNFNGTP